MDGVPFQQVGVGGGIAQVVDGDEFHVGTFGFDRGAEDHAADAAKSIESDTNCHGAEISFLIYGLDPGGA
jgi:hypothetical protein